VSNLAVISHLHQGKRHRFIKLVDRYFQQGWAKLSENRAQVQPVAAQLLEVLDDDVTGKQATVDFLGLWDGLKALEKKYQSYL
jgi:type I restriction enzyme M protein